MYRRLGGRKGALLNREQKNHQLGTESIVRHRIVSAVESAEFVSDRMSYI